MDGFISGIKNPVDMPGLDCPWHGIHVNVVSWLIGFLAACPLRSSVATCYVLHSVLHHGVGLRCAGETITSPQCTKGAFSEDVIVPHQHTHMLHQI